MSDQYDYISVSGIRKILENAGVITLRNTEFYGLKRYASGFFHRPINERLEDVMNGQLLGDATLVAVGKTSADGLQSPSFDDISKIYKNDPDDTVETSHGNAVR